jgi:hypothetical protein
LRTPNGKAVLGVNLNVKGESGLGKTRVSGGGRGRREAESSKLGQNTLHEFQILGKVYGAGNTSGT